MAKIPLPRSPRGGFRGPAKDVPPRLTVYRDGLAKITTAARTHLGTDEVHVLHDSHNPSLVYLSASGASGHKLSKTNTFSASTLWQHVGSPDHPIHMDLHPDAEGDLVADVRKAIHTENRPPRGTTKQSVGVPAAAPRAATSHSSGTVDPHPGPVASGPTGIFADDDEDDDYPADDDDEIAAVIAAAHK